MVERTHTVELVNGLYRINLAGKSIEELESGYLRIHIDSDRLKAARKEMSKVKGLNGTIFLPSEGALPESYNQPWHVQIKMIQEFNSKIRETNPGVKFAPAPNAATLLEAVDKVYRESGKNLLPFWSRVGDGTVVVGKVYTQEDIARVNGEWSPGVSNVEIGVLPIGMEVPTQV
jgi:hypothetical protein